MCGGVVESQRKSTNLGVNTNGKHDHASQSSTLVPHWWNFDTEMPKGHSTGLSEFLTRLHTCFLVVGTDITIRS